MSISRAQLLVILVHVGLVILEVVFHQVEFTDDVDTVLPPILTHVDHAVTEHVDSENLTVVVVVFPVGNAKASTLYDGDADTVTLPV